MSKIDAESIRNYVDKQLSGYPWGGKCIAVYKNPNDEWVAECRIPGHYSRDCDGYGGHFYRMEDADCPIRQFIAEPWKIESIEGVTLHEAKNGERVLEPF